MSIDSKARIQNNPQIVEFLFHDETREISAMSIIRKKSPENVPLPRSPDGPDGHLTWGWVDLTPEDVGEIIGDFALTAEQSNMLNNALREHEYHQ